MASADAQKAVSGKTQGCGVRGWTSDTKSKVEGRCALMRYKEYSPNSQVGHWKGWIENDNGVAIGFVKNTGEIVTSW